MSVKNSKRNPNFLGLPPLPTAFYERDTCEVARDLLGKILVVQHKKLWLAAQLVEVEAYLGEKDLASHSARGPTPRNQPMFRKGGTCYVYFIYGMHHCTNVKTGREGRGEAVLFRSAKCIAGMDKVGQNRGPHANPESTQLLAGPGRLSQGLGLDRSFSGRTFLEKSLKIVHDESLVGKKTVIRTPRIGISKDAHLPLRFYWKEALPWVSRGSKLG